jgi:hypothetical protein
MTSVREAFLAEAHNFIVINCPIGVSEWESDYEIDLIDRGLNYGVEVGGEEFEVKKISASFKISRLSTQSVQFGPTLRYSSDRGLESHSIQGGLSADGVNVLIGIHESGSQTAITVERDEAEADKMVTLHFFTKADGTDSETAISSDADC